jgi:hypothetical protein
MRISNDLRGTRIHHHCTGGSCRAASGRFSSANHTSGAEPRHNLLLIIASGGDQVPGNAQSTGSLAQAILNAGCGPRGRAGAREP